MISQDNIRHIANLAKLSLADQEVELYSKQLGAILDHFKQLEQLDTADVAPLITATDMPPTMRDDAPIPSLGADGVLSNAPDRSGDLYKVPAIL